ncbi:MAG: heme b synthase [Deltaproteobacteria bacterium]|nr:heme b synthase [Deltaproteobacteria bacterium]
MNELRMIAWEITRRCNLACIHCRASAERGFYPNELTTRECLDLIDDVASFSKPVIILTGGEPLLREDIFEVARYGSSRGLRMVMAVNGTLVDETAARNMQDSGIQRISVSIDGATAESHDRFRQVPGAFEGALRGIRFAKKVGLEFQINTTVTKHNRDELPALLDLAIDLGAAAHHVFLLVPTGRGKELAEQQVTAQEYEEILTWFYDQKERSPLHLKATCAPQFYRILRQKARDEGKSVTYENFGLDATTRGCLGGVSFCFISHVGEVQPCGYLELNCGNIRQNTLEQIWEGSRIFRDLRDFNNYKGRCGRCEYRKVCGGCRARAYEMSGDFLAEEPFCTYEPRSS